MLANLKNLFLIPLSWLFGGLVALKNLAYDRGWKKIERLPVPVISVGNLSMGGTGKSPVVAGLIELLQARGLKVAVLSRGYGRREPKSSRIVEPYGDWRLYGDEPTMLARAYPEARILVGPSRYEAARLVADNWPDIFVVDDGFQHRQLARDLDIVLIDVTQPKPRLFPLETFREYLSSLRRAQLVMLTRWDGISSLDGWRQQIEAVNSQVPVLPVSFEASRITRITDGKLLRVDDLPDRRVAAYAGIAQPEKFFRALNALGLDVVITKTLGDHAELSQASRNQLLAACKRDHVEVLFMTDKDAVKLENLGDFDILLCSLSITTNWGESHHFNAVIDRLTKAEQ